MKSLIDPDGVGPRPGFRPLLGVIRCEKCNRWTDETETPTTECERCEVFVCHHCVSRITREPDWAPDGQVTAQCLCVPCACEMELEP